MNITDSISPDKLKFIINHVFLPPQLPDKADEEKTLLGMNNGLLSLLLKSSINYQRGLGEGLTKWTTAVGMLGNLCTLQGQAGLSKSLLSERIGLMRPGDVLTLHIAAQNAGIILQHLETEMIFLSFEASPASAEVMGNTGKLICSYPGPAIAVPISKAKDLTFRNEFSSFVEQMDCTVLPDAMPKSNKANTEVAEERDTAHPMFITEMLTGILRAIGRPFDDAKRFQKRIADEVLWNNAKLPWRRSPLWLVVRVALRITLDDPIQYKSFMIFFLAEVLEVAVRSGLKSDLLFVMSSKLSRRAYKLRDHIPPFVLSKAYDVISTNESKLKDRWIHTQVYHSETLEWAPKQLSFEGDSHLSLRSGGKYLAAVMGREVTDLEPLPFNAVHPQRNPIIGASGSLPKRNLLDVPEDERCVLLADFEVWVQENLDTWVEGNKYREQACVELLEWTDDYTTTGEIVYQSNPENMSIMLLTTYELWVAVDKVAVNHYPLLKEYDPELLVPGKLFESLLLPRYQQMERLHRVETYLQQRKAQSSSWNPSIFSSNMSSSSFAVRYFQQSTPHQQLARRIESDAERAKAGKIEEFNRKSREYDDLISSANRQSCTQYRDYRGRYRHPYCGKCNDQQRARGMRIDIQEWPLPKDNIKRMAVVFELKCPMGFSKWRDMTYKILADVCTPARFTEGDSQEPWEQLWNYSELSGYYGSSGRRLAWSSTTKSFRRSHYSDRGFPTSVDSICVDNALNYKLYDTSTSRWTTERLGMFDVKEFCTFSLPEGSVAYKGLQYAVDGTSHTSNDVISKQHDCPIALSLHEYISFGTLRAGHRLQWLNIARELRTNTLTFSDEAINVLFMQAAWQAGLSSSGSSSVYRECHADLETQEFGDVLLEELECMLTSIEANWLESTSAKILIHLAARLLSANKHYTITDGVCSFLRRARGVALEWTRRLVKKLQECEVEEDMKDLQLRVLQMAAICRATYDVDEHSGHLEKILNSEEDVAVLVECATIVHDNTPAKLDSLPRFICHLLDRDRRLSHTLERYLSKLNRKEVLRAGLDRSMKHVYSDYLPGLPWSSLPAPRDRWMTTKTAGGRKQTVYYNLINGQLLIDGSPVGRMPLDFVRHPTYLRLFRTKVLDVFPSGMLGMRYLARHIISDHQVHFSMHQDELVIRTQVSGGSEVWELVPYTKLLGDLPIHFVEGYMHWLNVRTGIVEFRPLSDPWTISPGKNWLISYSRDSPSLMSLGDQRMLDVQSPTAKMIGQILSPLEDPIRIDIVWSFQPGDRAGLVSAHLPRLGLDFFGNENGKLECRQFRGAIVDREQGVGTMTGLLNRLVLRQNEARSVIIPYGEVHYDGHENHVKVQIKTEGQQRVKYHLYSVDRRLGRLVGNSLAGHLYKIYLHAVTAHCLPDPLTSRSGTEEALDNLRSATTWSFQKLVPEEVRILQLIASLTPIRLYYPKHLEVMQTVFWKAIPPTMQHDEFHTIVKEIFAHATQFHVFWTESEVENTNTNPYYKSKSSNKLLERAAVRNATYRKHEFGGLLAGTVKDTTYIARDSQLNTTKETIVCTVAKVVESWRPGLGVSRQLMNVLEGWETIQGEGGGKVPLGYDHQWVNPNLAAFWGSIYNACRQSERSQSTYQLMFFLSTLAFSGRVDMPVIGSLLAFATLPQFRCRSLPEFPSYHLCNGYTPVEGQLKGVIDNCMVSFELSQEADLSARSRESEAELWRRQNSTYRENRESQSKNFLTNLISQWPCASIATPSNTDYRLIKTSQAMSEIRPMFDNWYRNRKLREHISDVQGVLDTVYPVKEIPSDYVFQPCKVQEHRNATTIQFENLLLRDAPEIPQAPEVMPPVASRASLSATPLESRVEPPISSRSLKELVHDFSTAHSRRFEKDYADSMLESLKALEMQAPLTNTHAELPLESTLVTFVDQRKNHMENALQAIQNRLAPSQGVERMMDMTGLWPCISPVSLLQQLSVNTRTRLSTSWKRALVSYGKAITMLQRSERLLTHAIDGKNSEFHNEAANIGHQEWDPEENPDWLLIEIENSLLVRPVQNRIAVEMIKPGLGKNQTLQLNMGEGKSSVIVPIVAAALANGEKLVRVVVLKPLCTQMFRLLVQKLSGLSNRRIFYMPFSRDIKLDEAKGNQMLQLYKECKRVGGVILVLPEHILSFKLIGLERLYRGDNELARVLLGAQQWLERNTRDILDESDEILHVRHELIYTIGQQHALENSPDRWLIIQQIFDCLKVHVAVVSKEYPQGLEVEAKGKPGCFPVTRILKVEAGRELLSRVTGDIMKGHLPAVSFRLLPINIRPLARDLITDPNVTQEHTKDLHEFCSEESWSSLLLLRGLIAEGILSFALKEKRWRVDYGLTPERVPRTGLAVPFRAKDIPAPRAEFSQPDVAITLTCLSYYYAGLTDKELEDCFKMLFQLSNPVVAYEGWIQGFGSDYAVPETLLKLSGVNLLDRWERTHVIFPLFRFSKSVIDFYLSNSIFPKEAKEFPFKLSSSGWDISAEKAHPTTGFSGTNDNRDLLPLSVTQNQLPEQLGTNAKVLIYLLQQENGYVCAHGFAGERLGVEALLNMLVQQVPTIKVLLDVGAQVLELKNEAVAVLWLSLVDDSTARAVVFFDDDELMIRSRDGTKEPFEISSFSKQMDQCLVYLDEAHTRGTDLKLPLESRAAVTLGPNLTKDRLVQACMRMRKLGQGQSVLFCAPPEIHTRIMEVTRRPSGVGSDAAVNVSDVLLWSMIETCISNRNNAPIWAKQGINFQGRHLAYQETQSSDAFPESLREQEAQSLEQRYGIQKSDNDTLFGSTVPPLVSDKRAEEMGLIRERCEWYDVGSLRGANAREEQERELSYEVEREQQIERPPPQEPLAHSIHNDVRTFIEQGVIARNSTGFMPAFESLLQTSAGNPHKGAWSTTLLVTKDFTNTIKEESDTKTDQFLRPVHWVVSACAGSKAAILSPYEINELIPQVRRSNVVNLHIYSPRVTKGMRSFLEDLPSWTIPSAPCATLRSFALQLNIFAGQLYLKDQCAYEELCEFLGLFLGELPADKTVKIYTDGFVEPGSRNDLEMLMNSPFSESPVLFLRKLIGFRRKDQDYLGTHLGQILHGRLLTKKDFDVGYHIGL